MTAEPGAAPADAIRARYQDAFGTVPAGIQDRIEVAEATGRLGAVEAIEELRQVLLADNPLGARLQQLVHFAQLVALGKEGPARLHARGAIRAGASMTDLVGVAETSLVTAGMPAYALAIGIIAEMGGTSAPAASASAAGPMWDRRFAERPWPTEPDAILVELAGPLPAGRGLDLGSGPGRNSLWLAAAGWDMTLLDASGIALAQAEERAAADGLRIHTLHGDVLEWQPAVPSYDLVIVANLHPGMRELTQVLAAAAEALVAGGHLFVIGHDVTALGHHGPPDPDRLLTVDRLSQALPATLSVDVLERRQRHGDHSHGDHSHADHGHGDHHGPADDAAGQVDGAADQVVLAWATKRAI